MFAEELLLFIAYTWVLLPFVSKCITPPSNIFSCWIEFLTPVIIREINMSSFSFPVSMELVICIFSFDSSLVHTSSSVILLVVSFYSVIHSSYSKQRVASEMSITY